MQGVKRACGGQGGVVVGVPVERAGLETARGRGPEWAFEKVKFSNPLRTLSPKCPFVFLLAQIPVRNPLIVYCFPEKMSSRSLCLRKA